MTFLECLSPSCVGDIAWSGRTRAPCQLRLDDRHHVVLQRGGRALHPSDQKGRLFPGPAPSVDQAGSLCAWAVARARVNLLQDVFHREPLGAVSSPLGVLPLPPSQLRAQSPNHLKTIALKPGK